MDERSVSRASLSGSGPQVVFTFDGPAPSADRVRVGNGRVAWLEDRFGSPALATWDGKIVRRYSLVRHGFARNFDFPEGDEHRETAVPLQEDAFIDDFLLSPDGLRLAWGLNITTGGSARDRGAFDQQFLVYLADRSGPLLRRPYRVDGVFADNWEKWRLRFWLPGRAQGIFITRYHGDQLSDREIGLYRLDPADGTLVSLDEGIDHVIGLSDDGRLVAHTANDETCCAGINYTNNVVGVKDLSTGADRNVFDEWKRFGNEPVDPGDTDEVPWEDYEPRSAFFAPGQGHMALTVGKRSSLHPRTARNLTFVIPLGGGGKERILLERSALGWLDDDVLVLAADSSTYLFRMTTGEETAFLKPPALPLTVGP